MAALFEAAMWFGATIGDNTGLLANIQAKTLPVFTPLFWQATFFVGALGMTWLSSAPRTHEGMWSTVFFLLPVSLFFSFLVIVAIVGRTTPPPYFVVILVIGCLLMIDLFVARTRVVNFLLVRARADAAVIVELRIQLNEARRSQSSGDTNTVTQNINAATTTATATAGGGHDT